MPDHNYYYSFHHGVFTYYKVNMNTGEYQKIICVENEYGKNYTISTGHNFQQSGNFLKYSYGEFEKQVTRALTHHRKWGKPIEVKVLSPEEVQDAEESQEYQALHNYLFEHE